MSLKVISTRQKKRIEIQTLARSGMSNRKISKELNIALNTVILWRNRKGIDDKPKGRPQTKLDRYTKSVIKRKLYRKNNSSIRKTTNFLNKSKNYAKKKKKISIRTVNRFIKSTSWGKNAYKSPFKPKLSEKNILDRIKFAKIVKDCGYLEDTQRGEQWRSHILFTDESTIELYPKSLSSQCRFRTEKRQDVISNDSVKFSPKIMIAGGFCAQGVSKLYFVENDTINGEYYKENILPIYLEAMNNPSLFPIKSRTTFMQDGAPSHSTKVNIKYLESKIPNVWGKGVWPGNSPDLNPIENLWSLLKVEVQKNPVPQNISSLKARIKSVWENFPLNLLKNLSESFKKRVTEMNKLNGGNTKY